MKCHLVQQNNFSNKIKHNTTHFHLNWKIHIAVFSPTESQQINIHKSGQEIAGIFSSIFIYSFVIHKAAVPLTINATEWTISLTFQMKFPAW